MNTIAALLATAFLTAAAIAVDPAAAAPSCTGFECYNVQLLVQDQCVWARNIERLGPVALVLTLAGGNTLPVTLKGAAAYTAANAPPDTTHCDNLERQVATMNRHGAGAGALPLAPELKKCNAEAAAVRAANLKKDEYFDKETRPVRRRSTVGIGGSFMGYEIYPVYWMRLKVGTRCIPALEDIKSFTASLANRP